jgi:phosphonoacetaldehyde hydrolase
MAEAKWYVVHTYSGYENKVKANIEKTIENNKSLAEQILEVRVPMQDVVELNHLFEKYLFASLKEYTDPIPGVIPTLEKLRAEGLKIGSTTGYTREMMDVVLPEAQAKGYRVDYCATPNLLPAGRPAPYMIFENLTKLAVPDPDTVVKVGDTIADIQEGVHAKVWSVGVVLGSNEMALTEEETYALPAAELENRIAEVKQRMLAAGASYVIRSIEELPALIQLINSKLNH